MIAPSAISEPVNNSVPPTRINPPTSIRIGSMTSWLIEPKSGKLIAELLLPSSRYAITIGVKITKVCTIPARKVASSFPTIKSVGFSVVRIISVTRFSFSSTVLFSRLLPSITIAI